MSPVALRRPAFRQSFELAHRLPFGCHFLAQFPALLSFAIKRVRHRGRTAHFAEKQDLDFKIAAVIGYAQSCRQF